MIMGKKEDNGRLYLPTSNEPINFCIKNCKYALIDRCGGGFDDHLACSNPHMIEKYAGNGKARMAVVHYGYPAHIIIGRYNPCQKNCEMLRNLVSKIVSRNHFGHNRSMLKKVILKSQCSSKKIILPLDKRLG